jgi:hypothetical protein
LTAPASPLARAITGYWGAINKRIFSYAKRSGRARRASLMPLCGPQQVFWPYVRGMIEVIKHRVIDD